MPKSIKTDENENTTKENVENEIKDNKIGAWRAGWNISNSILSISILNEPYAVLQSGISGLVFTVISGLCTCYTSIILRHCLYDENKHGKPVKILHSYAEIGQKSFNSNAGAIIINLLVLIQSLICGSYLFLQAAVLINKCFDIESLSITAWMIFCTVISLPYVFLDSLKSVSRISLIGNIAQTVLTIIVMVYCFSNIQNWNLDNLQGDMKLFPFTQSLTVILISFCSTYYAPITDSSMRDVSRYNCMMIWTHGIATMVKVIICGVVVLMWGTDTKDTFTNNLPIWPYIFITNPILAIRSLTNLPNPYFLSVSIIETEISKYLEPKTDLNENTSLQKSIAINKSDYHDKGCLRTWKFPLRLCIILTMLLLALGIPFLELLLGFLSCISGIPLLIILPCLFHLRLKKDLLLKFRLINIICIFFGTALSIFGLIANIEVLYQSNIKS